MFIFDSVDSVLSDIQRKVERLRKIQQNKVAEAEELEDEAAILHADAIDARQEAARAAKVAAKFQKFLEE